MNRTSSASRRRLERGQFSWVTLLLLSGLLVGGYLAVVWAPVLIVQHEVKQLVRTSMNRAVKEPDDQKLVLELCQRLRAIDQVELLDEAGDPIKVPAVDVAPEAITWERDAAARPPTLRVAFEYVRVVRYPWLDRTSEIVMSVDLSDEIGVPNWGTPR